MCFELSFIAFNSSELLVLSSLDKLNSIYLLCLVLVEGGIQGRHSGFLAKALMFYSIGVAAHLLNFGVRGFMISEQFRGDLPLLKQPEHNKTPLRMDLFAELEPAKEVLSLLITQCFEAFSWQVIRALISLVSSGKPLWLMWVSVHQNHSAALVKNSMHLLEMFADTYPKTRNGT